ncbi:MAG: hypothetical protein HGA38_03495 [Candidatus Moranbacteria bacterium]|nr:hypothetical protein [Candidatus Moranbacteria bacterium]
MKRIGIIVISTLAVAGIFGGVFLWVFSKTEVKSSTGSTVPASRPSALDVSTGAGASSGTASTVSKGEAATQSVPTPTRSTRAS